MTPQDPHRLAGAPVPAIRDDPSRRDRDLTSAPGPSEGSGQRTPPRTRRSALGRRDPTPGPQHRTPQPLAPLAAVGHPGPAKSDNDGEVPCLYTPAQAARLLTVRESWLRHKAAARAIPCTFLGRHLRFSPADLRAITATGARPARGPRGRPRHR
jgi:excisionase family DNA binding protein